MSFEYDSHVDVSCDNDGCYETEYNAKVIFEEEHRGMARYYGWHYDDEQDKVYCPECLVSLGLKPGMASDLHAIQARQA